MRCTLRQRIIRMIISVRMIGAARFLERSHSITRELSLQVRDVLRPDTGAAVMPTVTRMPADVVAICDAELERMKVCAGPTATLSIRYSSASRPIARATRTTRSTTTSTRRSRQAVEVEVERKEEEARALKSVSVLMGRGESQSGLLSRHGRCHTPRRRQRRKHQSGASCQGSSSLSPFFVK